MPEEHLQQPVELVGEEDIPPMTTFLNRFLNRFNFKGRDIKQEALHIITIAKIIHKNHLLQLNIKV